MFDAKGELEALCSGENWVNQIEGERTVTRIASVDRIPSIPTNVSRASDRFDGRFIVGLIVVLSLVVMLGLIGLDFVDRFSGCRCYRRFCDIGRGQFRATRWPK